MTVGHKLNEPSETDDVDAIFHLVSFYQKPISPGFHIDRWTFLSKRCFNGATAEMLKCIFNIKRETKKCSILSRATSTTTTATTKQLLYRYMNLKHIYFNLSMEFVFSFVLFVIEMMTEDRNGVSLLLLLVLLFFCLYSQSLNVKFL